MGYIVVQGINDSFQAVKIDKYALALTSKVQPKLLFIPTASGDDQNYIMRINEYFTKLGVIVDVLDVCYSNYTDEEIRKKIFSCDIIYIGDGDLEFLIDKFKELYIDVYIKDAYQKNIVLSGVNAGAICYCLYGINIKENESYQKVYGMNMIKVALCPNYQDYFASMFDTMILNDKIVLGIALEKNAALVCDNGSYYIIKADASSKGYLLEVVEEKIVKTELSEYIPVII